MLGIQVSTVETSGDFFENRSQKLKKDKNLPRLWLWLHDSSRSRHLRLCSRVSTKSIGKTVKVSKVLGGLNNYLLVLVRVLTCRESVEKVETWVHQLSRKSWQFETVSVSISISIDIDFLTVETSKPSYYEHKKESKNREISHNTCIISTGRK